MQRWRSLSVLVLAVSAVYLYAFPAATIPYAIAVGMLRGDAGLVDYEEAVVRDAAVRALAGKVRYVIDPDNPYPRQFTGHVRVTLRSGDSVSSVSLADPVADVPW